MYLVYVVCQKKKMIHTHKTTFVVYKTFKYMQSLYNGYFNISDFETFSRVSLTNCQQ